jgi:hypothetical protein
MPNPDADKLAAAIDELVEHGHDDLPEGPASPLGGEARPNLLTTRPEPFIRGLAELGMSFVDERLSARARHAG